MTAVRVDDLVKTYPTANGALVAVDHLSLEIADGEVYALLGTNGAGKTSTVEILEGYRRATSGTVEVLGADPSTAGRDWRDRIGIVLQSSGIEAEFTVREVVELYASAYRRRRSLDEVLDLTGLGDKADDRVGSLSGGQRRRLDLGLGIVGHPDVLFLDEPTTGFDAGARRRAWDLVESLGADGTTVILTTHYLDEAERLAGRVGVLSAGRMVAEGTPAELTAAHRGTVVSFAVPDAVATADAASVFGDLLRSDVVVVGRTVEAAVAQPTEAMNVLSTWAVEAGVELDGLTVRRASLEDVFLELTAGTDE